MATLTRIRAASFITLFAFGVACAATDAGSQTFGELSAQPMRGDSPRGPGPDPAPMDAAVEGVRPGPR